jgi:hypothetical protein
MTGFDVRDGIKFGTAPPLNNASRQAGSPAPSQSCPLARRVHIRHADAIGGELMRFVTPGLLCAGLLAGTVVSAQERGVKTDASTSGVKVTSDNGSVETLTGCVMIGGGTNFLLTNITSRVTDSKKPSPAAVSYALTERDGVDLSRFINQRVQLTGVFVPAATKGDHDDKFEIERTGTSGSPGDAGQTSPTRETVKVPRGAANQFLVATVRSVAPQCAQ